MGTSARRRIGIVTDEASNIAEDFAQKHDIEVVKYPVWFPDEDEEIKDTKALYQRMREIKKTATTSAPPPLRFKKAYKRSLEKFDKVLAILLFKGWSGTFDSATQARNQMPAQEQERIEIFDTHLASVAEGLVVWKAQELINEGKGLAEILEILEEFRNSVRLFGIIEDLTWLVQGGRLRQPWATPALLLQKAGVRPAIGIVGGQIKTTGLKFSGKDRISVILKELKKVSRKGKLRIAVAHADLPQESISRLKQGIGDLNAELLFVSQLTALVGSNTGPGTILVAYHY
ncbi:DegV family protein [candidate division WOR-3 bacterium]|nr:DegV family protein [candidate division WOR-3 bacterium]